MKRYAILLAVMVAASAAASANEIRDGTVQVFKTRMCACCAAWIARFEEAGFVVEAKDLPMADLMMMKRKLGVPADLASCHTAVVADYVIEGHVPPDDVKRLVGSGIDAVGLAVAGMPVGSPGMEYGTRRDSFDVQLIGRDGGISVFSSYGERG